MAKIPSGEGYLRRHLSANDYYSEGERTIGKWVGKGSAILGLLGTEILPSDEAFDRLRCNRHPFTEARLTARTAQGRIAFFDLQCSAPKSVSVLACTFGDDRLRQAHVDAVSDAFAELEAFAAMRIRKGKKAWTEEVQHTGVLCSARFEHDASRALDAQLHTHLVTVNATFCSESGEWYALTESEILRAIRYLGKVYQNSLARRVMNCGYYLEDTYDEGGQVTGFEIVGVTESDRRLASQRRVDIERAIAELESLRGRKASRKEINRITRETREDKLANISTAEVRKRQLDRFGDDRCRALFAVVEDSKKRGRIERSADSSAVLRFARDHLFERSSVVLTHQLLAEALNRSLGGSELSELSTAVHQGAEGLCILGPAALPHVKPLGTLRGLHDERLAVDFVNRGVGRYPSLNASNVLLPAFLSVDQASCVSGVVASSDCVTAIAGSAGAGKTTVLRAIHSIWAQNGKSSVFCAPTTSATNVLREEGFTSATTLASLLLTAETTYGVSLRDTVVVVDEAGLVTNHQGAELIKLIDRTGARLLLVGDSRQHSGVAAGDFLAVLETHSKLRSHKLSDIRRQTVQAYRDAIKTMAIGHARDGLRALDTQGYLISAGADYIQKAALEYVDRFDQNPILIAPTWEEIHALTEIVRGELKMKGMIGAARTITIFNPLSWTEAQTRSDDHYAAGMLILPHRDIALAGVRSGKMLVVRAVRSDGQIEASCDAGPAIVLEPNRDGNHWSVGTAQTIELALGDRILIRQNLKDSGLVNGDVLTVHSLDPNGDWSGVDEHGRIRRVPSFFSALAYGYAVTSHKSQGRTADHVIVCAARLDAKAAYVSFSRGRKSAVGYTPDTEALIARLPATFENRKAAMDFIRLRKRKRSNRFLWIRLLLARLHRRLRKRMRRTETMVTPQKTSNPLASNTRSR